MMVSSGAIVKDASMIPRLFINTAYFACEGLGELAEFIHHTCHK